MESLEVIVDSAKWDVCFLTDLLRDFLMLQDRTDQLIPLYCTHGVASWDIDVDIYASDTGFVLAWAEIIAVKLSNGNAHFLTSRFTNLSNMSVNSAKARM